MLARLRGWLTPGTQLWAQKDLVFAELRDHLVFLRTYSNIRDHARLRQLAMYRGPSAAEAALLARSAPRSDGPEHDDPDEDSEDDPEHGPEPGPPQADDIAMCPVTGAFTDPAHESAFTSRLFRTAFPSHVFLMALCTASSTWVALHIRGVAQACWGIIVLGMALGLVGRVILHRMDDSVRSQRMGSLTWTYVMVLIVMVDSGEYMMAQSSDCAAEQHNLAANILLPLLSIACALINASHGLCFVHKAALIGLMMVDCLMSNALCIISVEGSLAYEANLFLGFVVMHLAEMRWRRSYVKKKHERRLQNKEMQERRGLEQRNEQLQTSNERLLYDMQHRGRPLDDDEERSTIRRGLRAGGCQPKYTKPHSSEAGGPAPSDSPPPSMPPGAPSSTTSGSLGSGGGGATMCDDASAVHVLVGADTSGASLCQAGRPEHRAEAAGLGSASPSEMEAGRAAEALADMAMAGRVAETQQKVQQKGGQKRLLDLVQVDSPAARVPAPAPAPAPDATPTFEQALEEARHRPTPAQALEEARHLIEAAQTDAEVFQVVYPLAMALGAKRTETGTVKALHGVVLQLVRPGLSNAEACTAVGASMSNFCKWRKKIQLGVFPHVECPI